MLTSQSNGWGKSYVRKQQVQKTATYCQHVYKTEHRFITIDDGMHECGHCGTINTSESEIAKQVREINVENIPRLTHERLMQLEEGTMLKLGPLDYDAESIHSEASTATTVISQIHAGAANLTVKSESNRKHNKLNAEAHGPVWRYLNGLIQHTTKSYRDESMADMQLKFATNARCRDKQVRFGYRYSCLSEY